MASTGDPGTGRRAGGSRGPSAAVYRRRRLAVTALVLLVVVALAVGVMVLAWLHGRDTDPAAGGAATEATGSSPTGGPSAVPSSAPSAAEPSPSATAAAPSPTEEDCAADVVVAAEADKANYAEGENPLLSLIVRNEGTEDCTVNVGTSQMEFMLTSDGERVFSSADCQHASQDLEHTIAAGGEERATFEWSRNRTAPGCTAVAGQPGSGTYTLITRLGARSSSAVEFTLQ